MASGCRIGQHIDGKISTYILLKPLHKDVWTASSPKLGKVIINIPPKYRLDNERSVLKHFHTRPGIRQLLDETQSPSAIVLEHFDDNLLSASNSKRLEKAEIRQIAKGVLEALQELHQDWYVHTDIKPDNILVNYGSGSSRFAEIRLGDCGDTHHVNPTDHLKLGESGHLIGAHMFRSPEAMLNMRLGTPTDIWSFGATPDPEDASPDDEAYPNHLLVKQIAFFGPFPVSYFDILPKEDERWEFVGDATQYIIDNQKWKPFALAEDRELAEEDRTFICKIMKLDPRSRPTAKELLQDSWFERSV